MLCCASSFVNAAYAKVRLIPQDPRVLPAAFLRSRPIFMTFKIFYEVVKADAPVKKPMVPSSFSPQFLAGNDGVLQPEAIILFWVVEVVVKPPALLPHPGASDNKFGGNGDVPQFQ